ncbi:FAD-dependent monooxygenase [Rhodoferax antarcticus]|uniref:Ubiquinone biosynthesis hydroxylase, UbiH/UbiF/VisC/COQ6 family protein n=1 Tax=Rhodoferax antarcticus ANT.BR TaxID=1111071 RepID=A0A1Q8YKI4_9BURK|nr:FAD-dependent monooxygenase [Rhodoferax antarcticus]APW47433.1 ubiquinone biosynthesis protein UbiH [Rhodoferax antarcticus]MCW2312079.1 2-polyprenyl-6-methoxyphenol hydroxylase-like FAD-dependent oxidoreductase [Rhodoferax antarcticus]OLP08558.1 ubiquinone biosynthesis hydroxylase, UbiH/UbiF/VisC/COQ6 family protein [Rhodoferax antarcticus ANT.BR]
MKNQYDICIRGGGIVGHTLALLLARERLSVGLVAQSPVRPTPGGPDVRAYALNAKSKALLESVRCWPSPQHATPVTQMRVLGDDGGEVNFSAEALNVSALTWIVDVPLLEARLAEAMRFQPQIEVIDCPKPATLTVVCEGKDSRTRAELGVTFEVTRYPQRAIAARLTTEQAHGQTARQWFTQGEILAFLPLDGEQGHTVGIVWSVKESRVDALMQASEEAFCAELGQVSGQCLGGLKLSSERVAWPLVAAQASRWIGSTPEGKSWALAGDAAHAVHPLAGQGLNLGLGDVADLASLLHSRAYWRPVNDNKLLRQYQRARRAEVSATALAMDSLQQLFSSTSPTWQALRNWGMNGFERSSLAKQWAARYAMGL